jgi:hypothetical protein
MIKLANNSNEFIGLESLLKDIDSISEETIFSIDSDESSFLYYDSSSNINGIENLKLPADDKLDLYYIPSKRCFVIKNKYSVLETESSDLLFRTGISFSVPGFDSGDNSLLFRNMRVASQILIKKFIKGDLSKADVETVRTLMFVINYDECGVINNTISNTKILFDEFQAELFIDQMKSYCLTQNQI